MQKIKEYIDGLNNEFVLVHGGSYVKVSTGEFFTEAETKKYIQKRVEEYVINIQGEVKKELHKNDIEYSQRIINTKSVEQNQKNKRKIKLKDRYDGGEFNIVYRAKIEVIENMKLNSNEKLIYLSLRDYVQYPTNCVMINGKIPSIDELVPITSLSSRAIKTSIKSLEEKCLIKRIQYGHKKAIYINPEYYASGKDLDIETLKMFGLLVCDDNKIDEYIDNNL